MEDSYFTKSAVLQRPGWSRTLLNRILGDPDKRKKSYPYNTLLALYLVSRVEQAEASAEFQAAQVSLSKRKDAAEEAVYTKKAKLIAAVQSMPINVQVYPIDQVRQEAIKYYNARKTNSDMDFYASSADDSQFLDRITVNFVRHELTEYDYALCKSAGKTGVDEAVLEIRKRVYSAIADAYPELNEECNRQLNKRTEEYRFKSLTKDLHIFL